MLLRASASRITRSTVESHAFTAGDSVSAGSPDTVRRNHGRAGEVMPVIIPLASVRAASTGVKLMIFEPFVRLLLLVSLRLSRKPRGRM